MRNSARMYGVMTLLNRDNISLWGYFIRVRKNNDLFSFCVSIFPPCRSAMKWAIQLDLSLDHVPGAAAVAQKAERGGAVSKTSVNKHRR